MLAAAGLAQPAKTVKRKKARRLEDGKPDAGQPADAPIEPGECMPATPETRSDPLRTAHGPAPGCPAIRPYADRVPPPPPGLQPQDYAEMLRRWTLEQIDPQTAQEAATHALDRYRERWPQLQRERTEARRR